MISETIAVGAIILWYMAGNFIMGYLVGVIAIQEKDRPNKHGNY